MGKFDNVLLDPAWGVLIPLSILAAPLMACSARIPAYALITAFIPRRIRWSFVNEQRAARAAGRGGRPADSDIDTGCALLEQARRFDGLCAATGSA